MAKAEPTLGEWLREGPAAMGLSSGFFGFFAHAGVYAALSQSGYAPTRLSGSSAGALVASAWAAGVSPEALARELTALERAHFWDPAPGLGLLRGALFRARLVALVGDGAMEDCAVPLGVSVFDVRSRETRVRDAGSLAAAVHASCAFPGLFQPVQLEGRATLDGGILDRPGLAAMPPVPRLLFHHLASRSPWRGQQSAALRIPRREGMVALVLEGLPRVNPFALERGRSALALAQRAAERALGERVREGVVRVAVG